MKVRFEIYWFILIITSTILTIYIKSCDEMLMGERDRQRGDAMNRDGGEAAV